MPLALDVRDTARAPAAVAEVLDRFGRLDVLVNNAGRGLVGAVEETPEEELRDLMDVHVFGPVALVRAVLPTMRERGGGTIVQVSSMGGRTSFAGVSGYSATKWALEGLSQALAAEVAPFGVRVLIVEPGAFRTGSGLMPSARCVVSLTAEYGCRSRSGARWYSPSARSAGAPSASTWGRFGG